MERIYPKANDTGEIGKSGRAWKRGYFTNLSIGGVDYTGPAADGTAGQVLATDGAGTLAFASAGAATAFDDIGDPDAAGTIAFTTFAQLITSTKTNGDGIVIHGLGAFGDVSVVRIEQVTGNPTDGTVLEVVAEDANVDPFVVSSSGLANAFVVGQNAGTVTVGGAMTVTGATTMTGALTVNGATCVGDGATLTSGFLPATIAVAATNPYTITAAESGKIFVTSQASHLDLPADPTGGVAGSLRYTFVVNHASAVEIDPNGTDLIAGFGTAGQVATSSTVGDTITLIGISATQWAIESSNGTWVAA
jgi:hypothetical protein